LGEVELEDVSTSVYFVAHGALPVRGTDVVVDPVLVGSRIGVRTVATHELIGVLPTSLNWIMACLDHVTYEGSVSTVTPAALPAVFVRLDPK